MLKHVFFTGPQRSSGSSWSLGEIWKEGKSWTLRRHAARFYRFYTQTDCTRRKSSDSRMDSSVQGVMEWDRSLSRSRHSVASHHHVPVQGPSMKSCLFNCKLPRKRIPVFILHSHPRWFNVLYNVISTSFDISVLPSRVVMELTVHEECQESLGPR